MGYVISEEGTRMDPGLVEAIAGFPASKDITDVTPHGVYPN